MQSLGKRLDVREYWDFGNLVLSRQRFRQLTEDDSLDPPAKFEVECQIARTYSLEREFTEAHRLLDMLERRLDEMLAWARSCYHLERGRTYNSAGDRKSAEHEFHKATQTTADDCRVDAYHMLAICATSSESAEFWNDQALALCRTSSDLRAKRWQGSLLNNLGWTYHDSGRYEDALRLFKEAEALRQSEGNEGLLRIARWCVARCLRSLGRFDEALIIQTELSRGNEDGFVSEELGELYLVLGEPSRASKSFAHAYKQLSQDEQFASDHPARLDRLRKLAEGLGD